MSNQNPWIEHPNADLIYPEENERVLCRFIQRRVPLTYEYVLLEYSCDEGQSRWLDPRTNDEEDSPDSWMRIPL